MSHFVVAVFARNLNDVDGLLAPFEESPQLPSPYVEFHEDEEADVDDTTGKRGYWVNPNAKWDWYQTGGRWGGMLRLKDGANGIYDHLSDEYKAKQQEQHTCDVARMRDVELGIHQESFEKALRHWDVIMGDVQPEDESEKYHGFYSKEYFIERYKTREKYATAQSRFLPYAYITPDGEWKAPGTMGWWGIDDVTGDSRDAYEHEFEEFLEKNKDEELFIIMVDCHI